MQVETPKIRLEKESADLSFARFVVDPLERGYGTTLGNSLRRMLLSQLPGAAAVGVTIDGVAHEFSTIKGVKEDVVDIILNLKGLAVKILDEDITSKKTLRLIANKAGILTAKDFETNPEVEILNPEHYICTLDKGGKIDMHVVVGRGRGYVSAERNKDPRQPIGYIPMDSTFTPVIKANYFVENTRVGQNIDYDKLTLEVTTNATVSAKEVVALSAKIVEEHTQLFVTLVEDIARTTILTQPQEDKEKEILEMSIEDLELSVRSSNCLKRANIHTVQDLINKTEDEMLRVKNLGKKSLDEIVNKLANMGLGFRTEED